MTDVAPPIQARLDIWGRFFNEIWHFLYHNVPGLKPEVYLLQLALAHADNSPVSREAEAWLASGAIGIEYLRKVARPRQLQPNACFRTLDISLATSVALHPDWRCAVLSSGVWKHILQVWDMDTGSCIRSLGLGGSVHSVALHPDGKHAVSAAGDRDLRDLITWCELKVWDLDTGECLRTLIGHTGQVNSVAVQRDGKRAVSASSDGAIRVWDMEVEHGLSSKNGGSSQETSVEDEESRRRRMLEAPGCVHGVVFQSDGQHAVSVGGDWGIHGEPIGWCFKVWDPKNGACLQTIDY